MTSENEIIPLMNTTTTATTTSSSIIPDPSCTMKINYLSLVMDDPKSSFELTFRERCYAFITSMIASKPVSIKDIYRGVRDLEHLYTLSFNIPDTINTNKCYFYNRPFYKFIVHFFTKLTEWNQQLIKEKKKPILMSTSSVSKKKSRSKGLFENMDKVTFFIEETALERLAKLARYEEINRDSSTSTSTSFRPTYVNTFSAFDDIENEPEQEQDQQQQEQENSNHCKTEIQQFTPLQQIGTDIPQSTTSTSTSTSNQDFSTSAFNSCTMKRSFETMMVKNNHEDTTSSDASSCSHSSISSSSSASSSPCSTPPSSPKRRVVKSEINSLSPVENVESMMETTLTAPPPPPSTTITTTSNSILTIPHPPLPSLTSISPPLSPSSTAASLVVVNELQSQLIEKDSQINELKQKLFELQTAAELQTKYFTSTSEQRSNIARASLDTFYTPMKCTYQKSKTICRRTRTVVHLPCKCIVTCDKHMFVEVKTPTIKCSSVTKQEICLYQPSTIKNCPNCEAVVYELAIVGATTNRANIPGW